MGAPSTLQEKENKKTFNRLIKSFSSEIKSKMCGSSFHRDDIEDGYQQKQKKICSVY